MTHRPKQRQSLYTRSAVPYGQPDPTEDEISQRFKDIWVYCMTLHPGVGTLPSGPCLDCVGRYGATGPPPLPRPVPEVVFREPSP